AAREKRLTNATEVDQRRSKSVAPAAFRRRGAPAATPVEQSARSRQERERPERTPRQPARSRGAPPANRPPARNPAKNSAHRAGENTSAPPAGSFESRTRTAPAPQLTSTQSPSAPLRLDLRQPASSPLPISTLEPVQMSTQHRPGRGGAQRLFVQQPHRAGEDLDIGGAVDERPGPASFQVHQRIRRYEVEQHESTAQPGVRTDLQRQHPHLHVRLAAHR